MCPAGMPRLFSFNSNARSLLRVFGSPDAHQKAQLKRVCIAGYDELVSTKLISLSAQQSANQQHEEDNEEQVQTERDYWLSREGRGDRQPSE